MIDEKLRNRIFFAAFAALVLAAAYLGLRYGSAGLSAAQVLGGLLRAEEYAAEARIIHIVRLPHTAACLLAGAALAVSGVLLQASTNNPLAGPNIIGVNAGAGFAVVLVMSTAPLAWRITPLAAFAGAFLCTLIIVFTANRAGGSRVTIVLAGVAVSALLNAGISLIKLVEPDLSVAYNYFAVGGVSGVTFRALALPAVMIAVCFAAAMLAAKRLDLMCLDDAMLRTLGVRARVLRTFALVLASALAAAAVSFAGLLGFVGLMVPHMARRTVGSSMRKLLPAAAMLGGAMVCFADLAGRVLFAPSEVPAGIITAFVGAPFFFVLLLKRRGRA